MHRKALYNLLRFTSIDNQSEEIKKWQIEDLRDLAIEKLFEKLNKLNVHLTDSDFKKVASQFDSPEEFCNFLALDKDIEIQDQIYLIVFELWRRLLKEKRCISIFCDELDHRIFLYDREEVHNDEKIQNALANLKSILDQNVDAGLSYKKAYETLIKYMAHDLENFLFDYVSEQIEVDNDSYAQDLIENFYGYFFKKIWFDFLKARVISKKNISKSNEIISNVINELNKKPSLDLQIRILDFMTEVGDRKLFLQVCKNTISLLKTEREFKDLLNIVADYFLRLDHDDMEKKVQTIINKRSKIKNFEKLLKNDKDLKDFSNLIL